MSNPITITGMYAEYLTSWHDLLRAEGFKSGEVVWAENSSSNYDNHQYVVKSEDGQHFHLAVEVEHGGFCPPSRPILTEIDEFEFNHNHLGIDYNVRISPKSLKALAESDPNEHLEYSQMLQKFAEEKIEEQASL